jgi:hypothetical protein
MAGDALAFFLMVAINQIFPSRLSSAAAKVNIIP